jgi:hypothetical protein
LVDFQRQTNEAQRSVTVVGARMNHDNQRLKAEV